ncbi:MAG: D-alanyl-D-alanine carboxypeptidase [Clostridia bacterium]|nr:D-alanyl-D-alanine carboxypeptidase [Clostridia bacterium]
MATALLFLAAVERSPVSAKAAAWIPCMSGSICIPAGDTSLPVALTGVSARGAVLMEAESGDVIFGQNQNARLPMASTTKIMTALVALEQLPLDTVVSITADSVGVEGSSIYLVEGEALTLEQLLYALLLESANDAAVAIAIAVAGSVENFAALMNEQADELGLADTHFVNPHGLDHEEHYTTARELALIARAALHHPTFREICSAGRKTIPLHGDEGVRVLINHNKLLASYEGCIGVKTGFTKKTGRCLVSAAERDGVTLIAVTLNAPDDWRDHTAMLDYGFGVYESLTLCEPAFFYAPLWTVGGTQDYVMVENTDTLTTVLRRDHGTIRCVVELPRFEFAPMKKGDVVGRLCFFEETRNGTLKELGCVPLYAAYSVEAVTYKRGLWDRIRSLLMR